MESLLQFPKREHPANFIWHSWKWGEEYQGDWIFSLLWALYCHFQSCQVHQCPHSGVGYQGVQTLPINQPQNNPRSDITNPTSIRQTAEPLNQKKRESPTNISHRQQAEIGIWGVLFWRCKMRGSGSTEDIEMGCHNNNVYIDCNSEDELFS